MKFTIPQEEFLRALSASSGVVPSRTTLPILSEILIETTDEGITLSATDLDLSVTIRAKASVKDAGSVTLPARRLNELIRELPPSPVHVESIGEKVSLDCEKTKFRFFGHPKADFPTFPVVSFESALEIRRELFENLVHHTTYAASTEDTRPILNGVLWEVEDGQTRMVATNGHRLASYTSRRGGNGGSRANVIVPPKALSYATRVFEGEETLQVAFGDNQLAFRAGGNTLYTRLIEGPYPNYQQVIPKDNDRTATADRDALIRALRRMSVVASDQTHRVKLSFREGEVSLFVSTPDVGEANEKMPIDFQGEPLEIGFNASYLLEVLKYVEGDQVQITFKSPERAALLTPAGRKGEDDYLALVMPLRLQE
ncbi:MAG: DNA polymerase III subunit beta [Gemmatimonadota bacterium]